METSRNPRSCHVGTTNSFLLPKKEVKLRKNLRKSQLKANILDRNQIKDVSLVVLKTSQWFRISEGKGQIKDLASPLITLERLKYIERSLRIKKQINIANLKSVPPKKYSVDAGT